MDGPGAGQRYTLGLRTQLGRSPQEGIHLDDPQASRRHALIQYSRGRCIITDSGSRNDTFVNAARIDQPTLLAEGDLIRIGDTTLQRPLILRRASGNSSRSAPG